VVSDHMEGVVEVISSDRLRDILVPGFYSHDERFPVFQPQPITVYLIFDKRVIACESVDQYYRLRMTVTEEITPDVAVDEDDEVGLVSVFELFIGDAYSSIRCTYLRYFLERDCDSSGCVVKCADFGFEGGKTLFLDPMHTFGIQIGNSVQRDRWMNDYFNTSDEYTEHWWRRD
jgi:hypothetical protein